MINDQLFVARDIQNDKLNVCYFVIIYFYNPILYKISNILLGPS